MVKAEFTVPELVPVAVIDGPLIVVKLLVELATAGLDADAMAQK
jgi:hypothetical protein